MPPEQHRPLTVGVVGTGGITKVHLGFLRDSPRARVVGVADLSEASASFAAERWGADRWFTSHSQMLAEVEPDVVHVLTPPWTHRSIVEDALQAGAHVICEKPLALTSEELAALQQLAERQGRWLLEDQNYRWNDPVLQLQDVVRSGRLGQVCEVDVRMALRLRDGGVFADRHLRSPAHDLPAGPIHDLLPHLVYLGLLFLPAAARPERVSAFWSNHGGDDGMWRWDDLDATVVAAGGHLRLRFSSATRPECFSVTVRGDLGEASIDLFQPYLSVSAPRPVGQQLTPIVNQVSNGVQLARSGVRNLKQKLLQHTPYHGLDRFLDLTYTALQTGGPPPLTYSDMHDTAQLIDTLLLEGNRR
jgi:predicted dehydrogenase